jgi:hypothetical protein
VKVALLILCFLMKIPNSLGAQSLPNWFGLGTSYDSSQSPHYSTWAAAAFPVSNQAQLYSFTAWQLVFVNKKLTTSTTTGLSTTLKTIKGKSATFELNALGTGGVSTGTITTSAFSLGGGAWIFWPNGFTVEVMGVQSKNANAVRPQVLAGFGYTWGK